MTIKQYSISSQLIVLALPWLFTPPALANTPPSIPYALNNAPFCGTDDSAAYNNYGGVNNQPTNPTGSFIALNKDGAISTWADSWRGSPPTDSGYVRIIPGASSAVAFKQDGSITAWGHYDGYTTGAPTDSGYVSISSRQDAIAALKADGSIAAWNYNGYSDPGAPTGSGYIRIASNYRAFSALKTDGSIAAWGQGDHGGNGAPTDRGYVGIAATDKAFAALKADGSITAWGNADEGGSGAPNDKGYIGIASNDYAFAALKADGSISVWGKSGYGGDDAPTGTGYISITSTTFAFSALKADGSITSWGRDLSEAPPTDAGYVSIAASEFAFSALKADGSISYWGSTYSSDDGRNGMSAPTDSGYTNIVAGYSAFAALKADGSISTWGYLPTGAKIAPSDSGYTHIATAGEAFVAMKKDGSLTTWGSRDNAQGEPTDSGFISINGSRPGQAEDCSVSLSNVNQWKQGKTVYVGDTLIFSAVAEDEDNDPLTYSINPLPTWARFDSTTGTLSGTPESGDIGTITVVISVSDGHATTSLAPLTLTVSTRDYDQDGVSDTEDAFPYDPAETLDTDGDGLGDNADGDTPPSISTAISTTLYCGSDYNSALNHHGGWYNQAHSPNSRAFAALHSNGTIRAWGLDDSGGTSSASHPVPTDSGYTRVVSTGTAFAAFKADGSVTAWGKDFTGSDADTLTESIYSPGASLNRHLAVLTAEGAIKTWRSFGEEAPTEDGYVSIASNLVAFAALKVDGSITVWDDTSNVYASSRPRDFAPKDKGYVGIASTVGSFAALKADGSITSWGEIYSNAPIGNGYISLTSNNDMFAALHADGSITSWGGLFYKSGYPYGNQSTSYKRAPSGNGYVSIIANHYAFAALKADGSITAWGQEARGGSGAPIDNGYVRIASTISSFAALKENGTITAWGANPGSDGAPTDGGYVSIASNEWAFAALKADGSITAWGSEWAGGSNTPTDNGYIHIVSHERGFVAMKADGSLTQWGSIYNSEDNTYTYGRVVIPGNGYISVNGSKPGLSQDCSVSLANVNQWKTGKTLYVGEAYLFSALAEDADKDPLTFSINTVPAWARFDPVTGTLRGTPESEDIGTYTVVISVSDGKHVSSLDPLVITVAVRDYDGDGAADAVDAFPYDVNESLDADGDGIGNNADPDDDNDGIPDALDADNDNDGMPDSWERAHGLAPFDSRDASGDADGDTVTNLDEYRADTDPQNRDSDGDGILDDQDTIVGNGLWGYACNVVNDPNSSTRRWGIIQYNLADLPDAQAEPVYNMAQNRKIQSVACDPSGDNILFSMKDSLRGDYEIYELDLATGFITQVTNNDTDDVDVTRSRDGRTVAWQKRLPDGRQAIELRRTTDSGNYTYKTLASASPFVQPALSPNGEWLAFVQLRPSFFAVMRYDITHNTYQEVMSIARRKKLYHPSITDDGNQVGWSERVSLRRYRVKDMTENTITDILNDANGIQHAVLSGDGQHLIYSINTTEITETYLTALETLETQVIGETLDTPARHLSSSWAGVMASTGFTAALIRNQQLTSVDQGQSFHFNAGGTGVRYPVGSDEAIGFTWVIQNGLLIITENASQAVWSLRLLAESESQYTVSVTEPDEQGGHVRVIITYHLD